MKRHLLSIERWILDLAVLRMTVLVVRKFASRLLWAWGRVRFGTMVPHRGLGCVCAWDAEIKYPQNLRLGERVVIGSRVTIGAHSTVELGDDVRISREVLIETAGLNFATGQPPYQHISKEITIESGVWIGARAIILGGVTIGENAVIAAGSVVSRSVPRGRIAAGVPARLMPDKTVGRS